MNTLDLGSCLLTCDGNTLICGDVSIPVSSFAVVDGRVNIDLPNLHVALLAEEWDALLGINVSVTEVVAPAPVKRGRRSS